MAILQNSGNSSFSSPTVEASVNSSPSRQSITTPTESPQKQQFLEYQKPNVMQHVEAFTFCPPEDAMAYNSNTQHPSYQNKALQQPESSLARQSPYIRQQAQIQAVIKKEAEFRKYSAKLYHLQRTVKALVYVIL